MFSSIPLSIRPREYDRTTVMRLIHECMGIPASPPATSEDSEIESDSSPLRSTSNPQSLQQQLPTSRPFERDQSPFSPQLIRIDECTMQLHFTPFYFGMRYIYFSFFLFLHSIIFNRTCGSYGSQCSK